MELSGKQRQQLGQALVAAFPTQGDLAQLLAGQLNINLDEVAPTQGDYADSGFEIVRYCEAQGRLEEMIQVASRHNPENPELQQMVATLFPDRFKIRYRSATVQYYTEPLEGLGEALPLQLILVPGGTFLMGSPEDERERDDDEGPQRQVSVPLFFMGRYPITQAQWRSVAALPQVERELESDPSRFEGDDRPVESVSWDDAVEFYARLREYAGRPYRLPSEAEWEYACRAGTQTPFYFGKTITTDLANYNGDYVYGEGAKGEYREETTPADSLNVANAFGLCDMHGNVWEWCADHWHSNYEGAPDNETIWLFSDESSGRVLRGGSWFNYPRACRSAFRYRTYRDSAYYGLGFRLACSAPRLS